MVWRWHYSQCSMLKLLNQKCTVFSPILPRWSTVPSSFVWSGSFLSVYFQGSTAVCLWLIPYSVLFQPCYETVKIWLQENLLAVGIFGLCTVLVQVRFNSGFQILSTQNQRTSRQSLLNTNLVTLSLHSERLNSLSYVFFLLENWAWDTGLGILPTFSVL